MIGADDAVASGAGGSRGKPPPAPSPTMGEAFPLYYLGLGWVTDENLIEQDWQQAHGALEMARRDRRRTGDPGYYWLRRGQSLSDEEDLLWVARACMVNRLVIEQHEAGTKRR